ncbi:MAG: aryl-sulfate sulfotransferase N-terminal domain-containing protein, partial [Balneolaceae bacterium]|nr:aryl-sulfate sulfotransferase N-terminal domain-containing protein [Balneolaceae bacterium]
MIKIRFRYLSFIMILLFISCKDQAPTAEDPNNKPEQELLLEDVLLNDEVLLNPSGASPLTAVVEIETDIPVQVEYFLEGKSGEASDVFHRFEEIGTQLRLPILGLYPDEENTVELTFYTDDDQEIGSQEYVI